MADTRTRSLLEHAARLEADDEVMAHELALVAELAELAGSVRARAAEVAERLAGIPAERETVTRAEADGHEAARVARIELDEAESRLAALENARRRREEEVARADRTARDARQALADAEARLARLAERRRELAEIERESTHEAERLFAEAASVASRLAGVPRLSDGGKLEPDATLAGIEEWGSRTRAALFVLRGTLETERERVVVEAEALGTAALGEDLHGASVTLVRQRLERALAEPEPDPAR